MRKIHGGGQPNKGPRDQFSVRPTQAVGDRIRQDAEAAGLPYGEYIARLLADHYGLPQHNPPTPGTTRRIRDQQILDLVMTG